jgi:hypothetical protein
MLKKWNWKNSVGHPPLLLFDVGEAYYKEGKEILDCQAGN